MSTDAHATPTEPTPLQRLTTQIEINSLDITQKLQAAVDSLINEAARLDASGKLLGFDWAAGRGDRLRTLSEAYYNVVAAEAQRRTSMRPAAPNITLPPRETPPNLKQNVVQFVPPSDEP